MSAKTSFLKLKLTLTFETKAGQDMIKEGKYTETVINAINVIVAGLQYLPQGAPVKVTPHFSASASQVFFESDLIFFFFNTIPRESICVCKIMSPILKIQVQAIFLRKFWKSPDWISLFAHGKK